MNNQNLFGQTYSEISSQILGSGTSYFQMLGNPMSFNWPVAPAGQISPQAYQLMSAAPPYSAISEASGFGTSSLFSNYKMIFSHVGFKLSPAARQQVTELSNQVTTAQNNIVKTTTDTDTAYNTALQNGGPVFKAQYPTILAWLAGPGKSYKKQIDQYNKQIDGLIAQIQALNEAQQPPALQDALNLTKIPTTPPSGGNAPRGWTVVPNQAGVLEWQPVFNIATNSQNWRAELTNGSIGQKTISLNASKSSSGISHSWAGGSEGYSGFFWGSYYNGSWSEVNISKSDSSVQATITLESATNVNITPGAWYDGGFLKQLVAAGSSGTGYSILPPYTVTGGDHALFGKNGLCSTMVTGLVVVYKPSFSVSMSSSTYKEHESKIQGSTGFCIGPFSFGGGSSGQYKHSVQTTGNTTTLSGKSTSDNPVIIGYTVGFPGVEKP